MAKRSGSISSFFQKKIKNTDGEPTSNFISHNGDPGISEINKCSNNPDDIVSKIFE